MASEYSRLIAYVLWITREGKKKPERIFIQRKEKIVLPITQKEYKLTLRNLKIYLKELKTHDSSIKEICIDKISRVGLLYWK